MATFGLRNKNGSCWINAALQSVFRIPDLQDRFDEDKQDEIYEYFKESETDSVESALKKLGEDKYSEEEIRLMRIKFMSEFALIVS
jgi:ubiquitin C-terminal hydrolase